MDGQLLAHQPLVRMQRRDGLLGGGNEVLVVLLVAIDDLVELLVELLELRRLGHHVLEHELRGLQGGVALLGEELEPVVDERLVEEDAPALEEVAAVADDLDAALGLVPV